MTAIKNCSCQHQFQSKVYGENKRVFNKTNSGWRCTVCDRNYAIEIGKKK